MAASSLKNLTMPILAECLGTTVSALYAVQLDLIEQGVMPATPGRGPGSGVADSAANSILLLVTFLAKRSAREIVQIEDAARQAVKYQKVAS